jgi:glycosyltransferase involved in cell wall biosynthesis
MTQVLDRTSGIAAVEIGPPAKVAVGRGNAFVVAGYCYHPNERTVGLEIEIGGSRQPVESFGLPRKDIYDQLDEDDPARLQAFRSGFVAIPELMPMEAGAQLELGVVMTLSSGSEVTVPLGSVEVDPALSTPEGAGAAGFSSAPGPRVAICMATYKPRADLLRVQLDSIRQQTHQNWICLISDDGSTDETLATLREQTEGDPRFVVSPSSERLGFYRNFERALSMVPGSAEFVTLADQDDSWHPGKLEHLLEVIGDAQLAYSDARIVNPGGKVIRPSYWTERRNNYTNFGSLLLANTVTGAASLFRRELLEDALPFPPRLDRAFHDHWLAMVAMAHGELAYLDQPLYDYVQHGDAVIGHLQANKKPRSVRKHLLERLRNPTGGSRVVYYYDWQQELLLLKVLWLRCEPRMAPGKRRTLKRLLSADRGLAGLTWLLGRRARRLWGQDETLDRELFYAYALVRRRAVSAWTAGRRRPNRFLPRDASIPPDPQRDR